MDARANGASTMVTAEPERHQCVANADTVDGADVPEIGRPRGTAALSRETSGKKRQVNHADAPQNVLRRFGTDLAPSASREVRAG